DHVLNVLSRLKAPAQHRIVAATTLSLTEEPVADVNRYQHARAFQQHSTKRRRRTRAMKSRNPSETSGEKLFVNMRCFLLRRRQPRVGSCYPNNIILS
ncbi:hypothetical protein, partial [Ralstonia mannitolilytica]